ncbi:MAG: DNA polymerase III subunit delta [Bacteroidales bacterium]|nr:DNA polymerase III subunit delta [Bacteroidales bacterium]MCM1414639.1 DNA polymerase III subunit delta [bacterium]MCM1424664.1 DNA polymerase III subunit delta [bacterium]
MKKLNEEIRTGQLKQAYLFCGEEAYLRRQYRDRVKKALLGDGDLMNLHCFEGKGILAGEVIDLAQTMPFLAERRVLVIENSGFFKKGGEELAAYLGEPAPTAFFLFVEPEIDKRSRLYKTVSAKGRVIECTTPDEATLKRWVVELLSKDGKRITERDLTFFLEKTGTDMENIRGEVEKLVCYCMDRDVVTARDIEEVCVRQIGSRIFDMVEAVADKRQRQAMELYYDLLTLKEPPMRILFLIARQFNLLLQVKELKNKGYDANTIGTKTGLAGFIARKYVSQASKFKEAELKKALSECVECEEAVKTGRMNDVMSVELLIVRRSMQTQDKT